ncbi:MexC family multidrug efflux RND transporter periplasmic adaptor subunit [Shewanella sairae]|uniref:MexC family multidrug efflux RND transporter periplasmic adaptor subunit n=1 Tax=Shewanella sairae TaxID=190310 RepID=A0ABQ4PNS2_9GAMM|nr:efflux RND transporter periplasmic adaptor subunit [Shewanella sairae]MCL1130970.1 efflux RND transporter periplasmic adaptor subunit [Shewanella sairae]GIU49991.1 MexC family multidrug efflux RND transporter periplasmic adaptor subunit [Shewanella sairae]
MAYHLKRVTRLGLLFVVIFSVAACNKTSGDESFSYSNTANVATVTAKLTQVTLFDELQGRVRPLRSAEIRPQVEGIITQRLFKQGDTLAQGEALFQIEDDVFTIDVEIKQAALAQSRANLALIQSQVDRFTQLDRTQAVSKQAYEEASFNLQVAAATVQQNSAQLKHSELQLEYATVTAPISGIIGEALVTEGALVSRTDPKPLAMIQQIDKVYIDVRQPASNLGQLRRLLASEQRNSEQGVNVIVKPSADTADNIDGKVLFSGISVDENTGDLNIRIIADNPQQTLLPGMYVRTQIPRQKLQAITLPEHAVRRNSAGLAYVYVISDGKFEQKIVTIEGLQYRQYVISEGVSANDIIVVTGQDRLREGATLVLSDWQQ